MKTLKQIESRLKELYSKPTLDLKASDVKKLGREAVKLEFCKKYLESNPTQKFLDGEIHRMEVSIETLEPKYDRWYESTPEAKMVKNPESKFRKDVGITDMSRQLKMLKFLNVK